MRISLLALPLLVVLHASAFGQLPTRYQLERDWMLDPADFKAEIQQSPSGDQVALTNGLIRRVIRLDPSAATVAYDNLMTDESIIRAVRPEGYVTLNGIRFSIGGLTGQPNRAFLLPSWVSQLAAPERALRMVGYEIGQPRARFAWKRTRHHAPGSQWPPRGVYLRMVYAVPPGQLKALAAAALPSDAGRQRLVMWKGQPVDSDWSVHTSSSDDRSSFANEGKPGEIYTPANTCVFIERPLAADTRVVEATIDTGTDTSASWGPGISLVLEHRRLKFYLRPGSAPDGGSQLAFWNGKDEELAIGGPDQLDLSHPWTLRMRWTDDTLFCEASPDGTRWQTFKELPLAEEWGAIERVRIGKTGKSGDTRDFSGEKGDLVRQRVLQVAAYGPLNLAKLDGQDQLQSLRDVWVTVHYELYDGIPVLSKWLTVSNESRQAITVDRFTAEELSVVEQDNPVETREGVAVSRPSSLHVETDMAFSGFTHQNSNRHTVHWRTEPEYTTQVNYLRQSPCRLVVEPTYGPAQTIEPGETFESFRIFELAYDSDDKERRGLALRRMYRTIAPWITENPLMMHMRTAKIPAVKSAIDQCAEVGFEMLILSFGSGFNAENVDPTYLRQWKEVADYAHQRGIEIGCYSLLSSRRVAAEHMIVSPPGQRPTHGNCPALTSQWGQEYFQKLRTLYEQTGFDLLEHDGSYPGDVDVTPRPPLQKGMADSRWAQWRIISDFYKWMRARGAYLNVPDYYYLVGSNKCGMGYRETNWSLPRDQQLIHTRQNIFDGTWTKTPSMGWMFVPLTTYHGGGAAATVEPLDQHLGHYKAMMSSNLAAGVQACYRGPRLYDTSRTKEMVAQQVRWFKEHRDILESDLIHGRRADGRDIDWMLHVNPSLNERGMLIVFNPTEQPITKSIQVPLYYAGLHESAVLRGPDGNARRVNIDGDYRATLKLTVPAASFRWYAITAP